MADKKKYIRCKKCQNKEHHELYVKSTRINNFGEREFILRCEWCGHEWNTALPCEHLRGYNQAEQARQERARELKGEA